MITICTVLIDEMQCCFDIFAESIKAKTELVDEVVIAHVGGVEKEWTSRGIHFRQFPHEGKRHISHTTGLHACIDAAKNDVLLLSDPDIFFYSPVDVFYSKLMEQLSLDVVGISHHNAINQCYTFFPTVVNMMVKKSSLPPKEWMQGLLRDRGYLYIAHTHGNEEDWPLMDGKFLIPSPIPGHTDKFPNHKPDSAIFDVGSNLYLWSQEQSWKWLSFQTTDCHRYTTTFCRGNVKPPKLPKQKLLYHIVGASNQRQSDMDEFRKEYEND